MDRKTLRQLIALTAEGRNFLTGAVTTKGSTFAATTLIPYPDDHFNDGEVCFYSGTAIGQIARISDFISATGTIAPYAAISPVPAVDDAFEIHTNDGWLTNQYNKAIDLAHYEAEDIFLIGTIDDTITQQDERYEYQIPTGVRYISEVQTCDSITTWGMSNYNAARALAPTSAYARLSTQFKVDTSCWVGSVRVALKKTGTITTTMTCAIMGDNSGAGPNTTTHGSGTLASSSVLGEFAYVTFNLTTPVYLTSGTMYHIVLSQAADALDSSNFISWAMDTSSTYSHAGAWKYYYISPESGTWSAYTTTTDSFIFSIHPPQTTQDYTKILVPNWYIVPQNRYLHIKSPSEGRAVRLICQRQATMPTTDTGSIELPEAYVQAKALATLYAMQPGGTTRDFSERLRMIDFWSKIADQELGKIRVSVRPNSMIVEGR